MPIKKYISLTRSGIMEQLQFRLGVFITLFANLIYLTLIYFLWKSIYKSAGTDMVNGMTFNDTMIYLVLATALFNFLEMFIVWDMSRSIQSGEIILKLLKPIKFKPYMFWSYFGCNIVTFFLSFLPTFIIINIITNGAIKLSSNLLLFIPTVVMALIINFNIDMFVSTICLYTESTWGINIVKESIVLLLSGATIPIAFFPKPLKDIVIYLPFKAIYDTPLNVLLMKDGFTINSGVEKMLLIQLFWCVFLSVIGNIFWKVSIRKITVNGG
ncbi:ABC-2 family transporter protein [Eubacterium uniforme]|uniref:ABC-2 type transport system permease protein n=1 Tax=Eubacterium uniforme TaxID=39495 RepID=A0A1T4VCU2_9FIRM|nr:ABC-2 family transporter protein [Eubacterium uniforme]SKA62747.1 ABC-2 type transport system permease protein [Eubacterium uniforme]